MTVGAAAVLGFSDSVWAQLLALATGVAMVMRSHLFRYTAQVGCVLAAGLGALVLLGLGLSLDPPVAMVREALAGDSTALDLRTIWLAAAVAAAAALVTAIGLIVPRKGHPVLGALPGDRRSGRAADADPALPRRFRPLPLDPRSHQLTPGTTRSFRAQPGWYAV